METKYCECTEPHLTEYATDGKNPNGVCGHCRLPRPSYSHISHIHCWAQKQPSACGIPLDAHNQCCLCDTLLIHSIGSQQIGPRKYIIDDSVGNGGATVEETRK